MVGVVVADKELSSRTYNTGSGGRFHFLLNYSFLFRSAHPPISTNQHLVAMFCSYFVYIVVLVEHSHCAAPSGGVGVDGNLPRITAIPPNKILGGPRIMLLLSF